ncbi:hypothetical protein SPSYN_01435 [Sporotomaculum syntrophicum]|uniref:Uncharacterized protein n=1 Tax=Sporotomaculum syntrophicum TaxID=182264 RepID=A0A9D2WPY9_9FIRM|nr:hypothetical protein [Sporotomaculum syntrophicum]KAF1085299.1 hypothetical protein SPSYN_01435 [Sporotomaculum syntrophicum]
MDNNAKHHEEFILGTEDWVQAARIAKKCSGFVCDDEDEMVADETVSCYNCRYRRWAAHSISCHRPGRSSHDQ